MFAGNPAFAHKLMRTLDRLDVLPWDMDEEFEYEDYEFALEFTVLTVDLNAYIFQSGTWFPMKDEYFVLGSGRNPP